MRFVRRRRARSLLDLGPLVDCVLQLLIFFMLSSTFAVPTVDVELPTTGEGEALPEGRPLVITATAEGGLWVDGEAIEPTQLAARLARRLGPDDDRVTLRADRALPLEMFLFIHDAASAAGAAHLDVETTGDGGLPGPPDG